MKDIDKELDEILRGIDFELRPLTVAGTKYADEAVVTGKAQAKQAIKQLINQARIDELKRWEAPENEIMMTFADPCNICGFNYKTLRQAQQDRLKELQEE